MQITRLTPDQAPEVAIAVAALLGELAPDHASDLTALTQIAQDLLSTGATLGLGAVQDGHMIGMILLNPCAAIYAGGRFGEISELWVAPKARSQGVASALIARALAEGKARGWTRIEVGAPAQPQWARSLAFYQREGFSVTGPRLRRLL
jgi:GNAT superfamily N-acetyltransferase